MRMPNNRHKPAEYLFTRTVRSIRCRLQNSIIRTKPRVAILSDKKTKNALRRLTNRTLSTIRSSLLKRSWPLGCSAAHNGRPGYPLSTAPVDPHNGKPGPSRDHHTPRHPSAYSCGSAAESQLCLLVCSDWQDAAMYA